MAQKLPSLNVLKVFDVAASRLSFKQAAEDLCLSPSAVSHQIKVLETQLGLPLFLRLPRGIELTEAGKRYHSDVKKGIYLLERATEQLCEISQDESITLSCIPFVTNHFLIPHLSKFKQRHPAISIKLLSQIERAELKAGRVDMAIRYQRQENPELEYIPLTNIRLTPICSPEYWQAYQRESSSFSEHKFISLSVDENTWNAWLAKFEQGDSIKGYEIELDNYQAVKQAATEGLGLAMGYWPAVQDLVDAGQLVAPYAAHTIDYGAMYLVYPKQDENRPSVQAVSQWIRELFNADVVSEIFSS